MGGGAPAPSTAGASAAGVSAAGASAVGDDAAAAASAAAAAEAATARDAALAAAAAENAAEHAALLALVCGASAAWRAESGRVLVHAVRLGPDATLRALALEPPISVLADDAAGLRRALVDGQHDEGAALAARALLADPRMDVAAVAAGARGRARLAYALAGSSDAARDAVLEHPSLRAPVPRGGEGAGAAAAGGAAAAEGAAVGTPPSPLVDLLVATALEALACQDAALVDSMRARLDGLDARAAASVDLIRAAAGRDAALVEALLRAGAADPAFENSAALAAAARERDNAAVLALLLADGRADPNAACGAALLAAVDAADASNAAALLADARTDAAADDCAAFRRAAHSWGADADALRALLRAVPAVERRVEEDFGGGTAEGVRAFEAARRAAGGDHDDDDDGPDPAFCDD